MDLVLDLVAEILLVIERAYNILSILQQLSPKYIQLLSTKLMLLMQLPLMITTKPHGEFQKPIIVFWTVFGILDVIPSRSM